MKPMLPAPRAQTSEFYPLAGKCIFVAQSTQSVVLSMAATANGDRP